MAAILCQGIGDCCSGLGKVCAAPFKLCGQACQGINKCCSTSCQGLCKGCSSLCDTISNVCTSPFFPYLGVTFLLNIPAIIYGISPGIVNWCQSLSIWLIINAVLAAVHIIASVYIVTQIRKPLEQMATATTGMESGVPANDMEGQHQAQPQASAPSTTPLTPQQRIDNMRNIFNMPQQDQRGQADTWSRVKYVLCLDKVVAVYILLFLGWFIFLVVGVGSNTFNDDNCDRSLSRSVSLSITCGFLFLFSVGVAFYISLCCLQRG